MGKPNRFLANTDYGISQRNEQTTALLAQLLTEQQRTNQLLEWIGRLLSERPPAN